METNFSKPCKNNKHAKKKNLLKQLSVKLTYDRKLPELAVLLVNMVIFL